jgi:hypothetical protein
MYSSGFLFAALAVITSFTQASPNPPDLESRSGTLPFIYGSDGPMSQLSCNLIKGLHRETVCNKAVPHGKTLFAGAVLHSNSSVTTLSDGARRRQNWWGYASDSYFKTSGSTNSPGTCVAWSQGTQCRDTYLGSGYSSAAGHNVDNYYDCLLKQNVERYNHPTLKKYVTRYVTQSSVNYRLYDNHNFAWFILCPKTTGLSGSTSSHKQTKGRDKRMWISAARDGTNCPYWDFSPDASRDPSSDATPITNYNIPGSSFPDQVTSAMYWPCSSEMIVDGQQCDVMAVSRPGLQHWTVKFVL